MIIANDFACCSPYLLDRVGFSSSAASYQMSRRITAHVGRLISTPTSPKLSYFQGARSGTCQSWLWMTVNSRSLLNSPIWALILTTTTHSGKQLQKERSTVTRPFLPYMRKQLPSNSHWTSSVTSSSTPSVLCWSMVVKCGVSSLLTWWKFSRESTSKDWWASGWVPQTAWCTGRQASTRYNTDNRLLSFWFSQHTGMIGENTNSQKLSSALYGLMRTLWDQGEVRFRWMETVQSKLDRAGYGGLWHYPQGGAPVNPRWFKEAIKLRLQDMQRQSWRADVESNGHCTLYAKFKTESQLERPLATMSRHIY